MSKDKANTKWKKTRHDKFYKLAKEQGYRSRACFKLIHLNKVYDFLGSSRAVVDLCAAPGGWLQVCTKFMPVSSLIIGIDILPIRAMKGVITMKEDITTQKCRTELKRNLQGWDVDCFLHDGAPSMGGATWHADAFQQIELVVHSLKLATEHLRPGGWFITKIFRSQDYNALLWTLNQFFRKVDVAKPPASRTSSAEIFAVCQGFLAPKSFDKKLLDPAYLFAGVESEQKKGANLFSNKKAKKNRTGYEDGVTLLYKTLPVCGFVDCEDPLEALATYNALTFDESSQMYLDHSASTEEIKELCKDLKVLGKSDLRALLRWLKKLRAYKKELKAEANADEEEEDEESEEELTEEQKKEQEEERITEQLEELHQKMITDKTKAKRKKLARKKKEAQRLALNALTPFDIAAEQHDEETFSLQAVKNQADIDLLADDQHHVEIDEDADRIISSESEIDSDDSEAGLKLMEENLDTSYKQFKKRRNMIERVRRKKLGLEGEEEENMHEADENEDEESESEMEDEEDENQNPLLLSLGERKKGMSDSQITKNFFNRGLFSTLDDDEDQDAAQDDDDAEDSDEESEEDELGMDVDEDEDSDVDGDDDDDSEDDDDSDDDSDGLDGIGEDDLDGALEMMLQRSKRESKKTKQNKSVKKRKQPTQTKQTPQTTGDPALDLKRAKRKRKRNKLRAKAREVRRQQQPLAKKARVGNGATGAAVNPTGVNSYFLNAEDAKENVFLTNVIKNTVQQQAVAASRWDNPDGDFEEVPESDFSSFSDTDAEAETMALGTMMIRKKNRSKLIDDSFNRYTWADPDGLPTWFLDNEEDYNTRPLPITKEQVDNFKEKLRAINSRPIKKLAEAKARKKQKAVRRWQKIQQKANTIAAAEGGSEGDKLRTIEKMYKKQDKRKTNTDKIYMVSKKGGGQVRKGAKGRGKIVNVDKRLKSDMRSQRRAEKKKKRGGGGKRRR